jgi:hypothetical protein
MARDVRPVRQRSARMASAVDECRAGRTQSRRFSCGQRSSVTAAAGGHEETVTASTAPSAATRHDLLTSRIRARSRKFRSSAMNRRTVWCASSHGLARAATSAPAPLPNPARLNALRYVYSCIIPQRVQGHDKWDDRIDAVDYADLKRLPGARVGSLRRRQQ